MIRTYLLLGYDGTGRVDEIISTFDTAELAKELVASGMGQDVEWVEHPGPQFVGGRWQIVPVPHNATDVSDWMDPR
jgi:hypothetical protein